MSKKKKIQVYVTLEADALDWSIAYGEDNPLSDVLSVLHHYMREKLHFAGANDAPFRIIKIGKAREIYK